MPYPTERGSSGDDGFAAGYLNAVSDNARERLRAEQSRLQADIDGLRDQGNLGPERESTSDLSGNDQHPADEGTETFDRERDLSILQSFESEMSEVQAAMSRLDDGTYGSCEVCGGRIGDDRLEALPATRFRIDHASVSTTPDPARRRRASHRAAVIDPNDRG